MAGTLTQCAVLPSGIISAIHCQIQSSKRVTQVSKMMVNTSNSLRIKSYLGLCQVTGQGKVANSMKHFKVGVAISSPSRKARKSRNREARCLGHNFVGTKKILLGLIGEGTDIATKVLKSMGVNLKDAHIEVDKIIGRGLLHEGEGVVACMLEKLGADPSNIHTQVIWMVGKSTKVVGARVVGGTSNNKMPTLEEYGINLTKQVEEGKLDPVVGRQPQIERVT